MGAAINCDETMNQDTENLKNTKKAGQLDQGAIHAPGTQDHTLCGMAFDGYESGDYDFPVIFASKNETVTCEQCQLEIDFVNKNFKKYKYCPAQ